MTRRIRRLVRAAFYLASVLVGAFSLAPSATLPPVSMGDKAEHIIAYAVLGLLGCASSCHRVARTVLGLSAFGAAIELLQAFSPGRSPEVLDALADIIGACFGCGLALVLRRLAPVAIQRAGRRRARVD